MQQQDLTPSQIVSELDKYIVGQTAAKRAVAIALRNRLRRQRVPEAMRDDITPKNIMMIGPTGVGKTEIARRVAKLINAPFIKVEATKFTETGYVGRDVESIVRDLAETAFNLEHAQRLSDVQVHAERAADERIINYLLEQREDLRVGKRRARAHAGAALQAQVGGESVAVMSAEGSAGVATATASASPVSAQPDQTTTIPDKVLKTQRRKVERLLAEHKLDEEQIEIDLNEMDLGPDDMSGVLEFMPGMSPDEMSESFNDFLSNYRNLQDGMRSRKRMRRVSVREAKRILVEEESHKLLDIEEILEDAVRRTEQTGVVFVDEIDKIAGPSVDTGPDISGEGVQRDLLPIVEGSTVHTRYGPVKTDHILFIAAGAFNSAKPSDLIPELQGRFPLRVELASLDEKDLVAILREPENALTRQYTAMLETEGVTLEFADSGIERIAEVAVDLNDRLEDIGARRLHTIMEQVLEELSFEADAESGKTVIVDAEYVDSRVKAVAKDDDLSRFIL